MNQFTFVRYVTADEIKKVYDVIEGIFKKEKNLYFAVRAYSSVHDVCMLSAFQYLIYARFYEQFESVAVDYKKALDSIGLERIDFILESLELGLKIKNLEREAPR